MSFIINLDALDEQADVTADDNGSYKNGFGRPFHVFVDVSDNDVSINYVGYTENLDASGDHFVLSKYNGVCQSYPDFRRRLFRRKTPGSRSYFRYCIVQYIFETEEKKFPITKHGNAKRTGKYKQTASSVRTKLKDNVKTMKPKQALHTTRKQLGGTKLATSSASIPRDISQAKNFIHRFRAGSSAASSPKDVLSSIMETCKKTMNKPDHCFIRKVEGAPEPMCIIGTEAAFINVERFCCAVPQGFNSILTIDPTFNHGDFYFTPTTYKNLSVIRKSTGEPIIEMGPAMVHYRKQFSTYHYMASSLVSLRPGITDLKCYGVDGEEALCSAFSKTFPFADELRCTIHSKRNVEGKLTEFAVSSQAKDVILNDIYGLTEGTYHQQGLIHAEDSDTFLALTESIKSKWESLERPHLPNSAKSCRFQPWFVANISPYMRKSMMNDVRLRNNVKGHFTTNQSESLNSVLRKHTNYKAHQLVDFLNLMKGFYEDQEEEVRSEFIGEGDFSMSDTFCQFHCGEEYYTMNQEACDSWEKAFYKCTITNIQNSPKISSIVDNNVIPGLDRKHSFNIIQKAKKIISSNGVVPFSEDSFHVTNSDGNRPHFIEVKGDLFVCDDKDRRFGCISFAGNGVCAHTYAVALYKDSIPTFMAALENKLGSSSSANLTKIAHFGLKEGAGKKSGNVRYRKRKDGGEIFTSTTITEQQRSSLKLKIMKTDMNTLIAVRPSTKDFHLSLLGDHPRVSSCGGCPYKFPRKTDKKPFPAPDDLVIYHIEEATWRDKDSAILRVSNRPQNQYYHPTMQCVRKGNNGANTSFFYENLETTSIKSRLEDEHLEVIAKKLTKLDYFLSYINLNVNLHQFLFF